MNTKTETKERLYEIANGPSKDTLFDACKYAYSKNAKVTIEPKSWSAVQCRWGRAADAPISRCMSKTSSSSGLNTRMALVRALTCTDIAPQT